MRSIGKKNIKLVKSLVHEAQKNHLEGQKEILDYVIDKLPEKVFDTWEGSYQEIQNIVWDTVFNEPYRPTSELDKIMRY